MDDIQEVVTPLQSLDARPTLQRGTGIRKSIRGVAVAPHLGAAHESPKRGSSVLHNIRGRGLPSISITETSPTENEIVPSDRKDDLPRPESRKSLGRTNSFSQAIRGLSTEHLRTLDSIDVLPQGSDRSLNEHATSQGSPRASSKVLPRRRSYVLHTDQSPKTLRSESPTKPLRQKSLLENVKEIPTVVPKLPGTIEGSPEKKTTLDAVPVTDNSDKKLPEKRKAFIIPPPPPTERQPSHLINAISLFGYSFAPLYDLWEGLQVSHCGQYSVERMLALDEYCQRVSIVRVLIVCLLFPLGPLVVIVLTECMPLQPVDKGALANYVFWIRHTIMGAILVLCAVSQAKVWISDMFLSTKQVIVVAIASATLYTALNILVADFWAFPIPFLVVTGAPFMFSIIAIVTRLVLGPRPLEGVRDGKFLGRRFLMLTAVHASLLGIYPVYQALFLEVDGFFELAMIALLPAINLSLKNVQTALGSHLEDNLPVVIIFSIDAFNAIYSVLCMHSANSIRMVVMTLVINTLVMILSLHGMNRRSRVARACRSFQLMERQQQKLRRTQSVLDSVATGALLSTLVATTLRMLQAPGQLDATELRSIRLLSGMPHQLSKPNSALLDSLATRSVYNNSRRVSNTVSVAWIKSRFSSAAMEGRTLSADHFSPSPPKSMLAKRLKGAVLVVPTSRWLSMHASSRGNSTGNGTIQPGSDNNECVNIESEGSETDKFPRRPSTESSQLPMLKTPTISAPRPFHLIIATGLQSVVEPMASPSKLIVPALWQETSDKLIPLVAKSNPVISDILEETRKQNTRAVKQTLQLLFNNEYLGLIAYTQCIIPAIYLMYMPVLQAVPNHVYYPTHYRYFGSSTEFDERMGVIGLLSLVQLFVFVVLQVFVVKRFGVSTIYQVAFVLETQFFQLQGRLLVWLIFAVQSTLEHYGVDFSFQFAWLHN